MPDDVAVLFAPPEVLPVLLTSFQNGPAGLPYINGGSIRLQFLLLDGILAPSTGDTRGTYIFI